MMRFTREHLRAAIESARYTDPRAPAYVVDTLVARQRATALYWFEKTAALDRFAVQGDQLCFDDLTIAYDLAPVADETRYVASRFDRDGRRLGSSFELRPGTAGRTCLPLGL